MVWFNIYRPIPTPKVEVTHVDDLDKIVREMIDIGKEAAVESFLSLEARSAKENYLSILLHRILYSDKSRPCCIRNDNYGRSGEASPIIYPAIGLWKPWQKSPAVLQDI